MFKEREVGFKSEKNKWNTLSFRKLLICGSEWRQPKWEQAKAIDLELALARELTTITCMWQKLKSRQKVFPSDSVAKNPPANAGYMSATLVGEDPTCRGAIEPVRQNYWACALEPGNWNYWTHVLQLLKATCLEPMLCNKRSHPMRSPHTSTRPSPRSPKLEKSLCSNTVTNK